MALPGGSTAAGVTAGAAGASAPTPAPESSKTPVEERVLPVGASIVASGATAVYAEPDMQALRFAEYGAGSRFTVVEPDGDHTAYPVVAGGAGWYRVRAEDGLVGWVNAQSLDGDS